MLNLKELNETIKKLNVLIEIEAEYGAPEILPATRMLEVLLKFYDRADLDICKTIKEKVEWRYYQKYCLK